MGTRLVSPLIVGPPFSIASLNESDTNTFIKEKSKEMKAQQITILRLFGLMLIGLLLPGCSTREPHRLDGSIITIDAPDVSSVMLIEGAGDDYTYYALEESPPEDWEDLSNGTLWICSEDERPSLIPEKVVSLIDGGGFPPGTSLHLKWHDQPGERDSPELGIKTIIVYIHMTYEKCTEDALEAMEGKSTALLLTETDGMFDGKDRLVVVEFD